MPCLLCVAYATTQGLHRDPGASDDDRRMWLNKLRGARWREVSGNMALFYDFEYLGGAKWLRKNKEAAEYFHSRVTLMAGEWQAAGIKAFVASGATPLSAGGGGGGGDDGSSSTVGAERGGGGKSRSRETNLAQTLREQILRDQNQMSRLKKGHFAHGVHRVVGGGGGGLSVTGGGDRSWVMLNHKLNARIDYQRAREAAAADAAEVAVAELAPLTRVEPGEEGGDAAAGDAAAEVVGAEVAAAAAGGEDAE